MKMGDKIIRVIGVIIIFILFLLATVEVKAEEVIEIKIPDEIKLKEFKEYSEENKIGEFADHTEFPPLTQEECNMLTKMAVAEAGNAGKECMCYVIQAILNRLMSESFPDTVSAVITQKGQFSTYPNKYNKAVPTAESLEALEMALSSENKGQLYFENTYEGSWQSTHLEFLFKCEGVSFYR